MSVEQAIHEMILSDARIQKLIDLKIKIIAHSIPNITLIGNKLEVTFPNMDAIDYEIEQIIHRITDSVDFSNIY